MTRLGVRKTWKLFIGGAFPRTESGRFFQLRNGEGEVIANMSRASRKDLRNAVAAARKALSGWSGRTAYNRGQILYRMAEMAEGRAEELIREIAATGGDRAAAKREVLASIDRIVHYAGWADKYQQIFSSVNPVSGPYYNFSTIEPTGVVGIFAPRESGLLGLVSLLLPAIAGGNTVVIVASEKHPTAAITLSEIFATSDLPAGVVNVLTGHAEELFSWMAGHMDVNAIDATGLDDEAAARLAAEGSVNVKRIVRSTVEDWYDEEAQSPYRIEALTEIKTVWHPIGV